MIEETTDSLPPEAVIPDPYPPSEAAAPTPPVGIVPDPAPEPASPPPPAASSSSSTASERGYRAIVFILVAVALVLVAILFLDMGTRFLAGSSSPDSESESRTTPAIPITNQETVLLRSAPDPVGSAVAGQSADVLALRLQSDSVALADLVTELQTLLVQKQDELRGTATLYTTAARQVEQLGAQLEQALAAAAETETLRADLANALTMLNTSKRRAEALEQLLAEAPDQNTLLALKANLDETARMRDASSRKASELESRMQGMVASDRFDTLSHELEALKDKLARMEPENEKLRYELQRVRTELNRTRLFVDKVDDLPIAAKMLFVELSKLETVSPAQLQQEYERIEEELGVEVLDTISFETGSSQIKLDKVDEIRRVIRAAGSDSYFLVVGYASKTGNFESNKQLSADRATTIASVVDYNKMESQGVNAVFLGQTDRFSSSNVLLNQICEIWELRKQE